MSIFLRIFFKKNPSESYRSMDVNNLKICESDCWADMLTSHTLPLNLTHKSWPTIVAVHWTELRLPLGGRQFHCLLGGFP